MKRKISRLKYFNGTTELVDVRNMLVADIERYNALADDPLSPTDRVSVDPSGPRIHAGKKPREPGKPVSWDDLRWLPVERSVKYRASASPHVCDWRCEGAFRHSECRCSCGGRNHGIRGRAEDQ